MKEAVICEPVRTPVRRYGGVYRDVPAVQLAEVVLRELVRSERAHLARVKALIVLVAVIASSAFAQGFPSRPIHLIVPYPPGGGGDIHGRLVGEKVSGLLGQPVVVENRAGASGTTGSDYVAKSTPDGYTLLVNTNALAVSQVVSKSLPFNVLTDFAPVSLTMTSQNMLVARPGLPASTIRELIAYAKANPGKLTYGASGLATPMLSVELLKTMAGINLLFVPYKGDAPGITDLLGGQTDMYVTNILPLQPHVRSGKLKALAVTSRKRAASLPDVPTMEEAGVAGFDVESWFAIFAPAKTPRPTIEALNGAIARALAATDVQKKIADTGGTAQPSTPEELKRRLEADVAKFGRIVQSAGIKVE